MISSPASAEAEVRRARRGQLLVGHRGRAQRRRARRGRSSHGRAARCAAARAARGSRSGARPTVRSRSANDAVAWSANAWSSTRFAQSGCDARSSSVSTAGWTYISVTPGRRSNSALLDRAARADVRVARSDRGTRRLPRPASAPVREADQPLAARAGHAQRQAGSRRPSRGRRRRTRRRSCNVPMWLSRWETSKPQ